MRVLFEENKKLPR